MQEQHNLSNLCFDDILLVPQQSRVNSRSEVNLSMRLGNLNLALPIISAPMDTVTEGTMAVAMWKNGGLGIIHRYMDLSTQCKEVYNAYDTDAVIGAAVGAKDDYLERAVQLVGFGASVILVDTANGHSDYAVNAVKQLRSVLDESVHIMAGNVSTSEGYLELAFAGADSVRVGIGGGSACTTRQVTGHGVPTLASVIDCAKVKTEYGFNMPGIIADGGLRHSGDIVKAFAAGADAVMLGSVLAGTDETPGEVVNGRKSYRGMASADAQQDWRGYVGGSEGVATTTPAVGTVHSVLADIRRGIQSGCSYSGVDRLANLSERARYIRVSGASLNETRPHAKDK